MIERGFLLFVHYLAVALLFWSVRDGRKLGVYTYGWALAAGSILFPYAISPREIIDLAWLKPLCAVILWNHVLFFQLVEYMEMRKKKQKKRREADATGV